MQRFYYRNFIIPCLKASIFIDVKDSVEFHSIITNFFVTYQHNSY